LILIGVCLHLFSYAFISDYNPKWGLLKNLGEMELVFKEGDSARTEIAELEETENDLPVAGEMKAQSGKKRIAVPYKDFYIATMILIFWGMGLVIFCKPGKKRTGE